MTTTLALPKTMKGFIGLLDLGLRPVLDLLATGAKIDERLHRMLHRLDNNVSITLLLLSKASLAFPDLP